MKLRTKEVVRYAINGVVATGVHYLVVYSSVEILNFRLVGLANFLASLMGISFSFVGNRYYVFDATKEKITNQLARFVLFYAVIAFAHGGFLYVWSDVLRKNYKHGFVLAVIIQFVLGYLANRHIVFNYRSRDD